MLTQYLPILILIIIAVALPLVFIVLSSLIGRTKQRSAEKLSPYECGVPPAGDTRERFSVRYYIIAMLFIVFDIEVIFLYPWGVLFMELGVGGLVEMFIFIAVLVIGLIYAWKKGALEWQ